MSQQASQAPSADRAILASKRVLDILSDQFEGAFTAQFWDGSTKNYGKGTPGFTLLLKHPGSLRAMLFHVRSPAIGFGEAFLFDDFDVDGDTIHFAEWVRHLNQFVDRTTLWHRLGMAKELLKLPRPHTARDASLAGKPTRGDHRPERDREAISYTYDLPAEFYELFLDRNMQYTCGYFTQPDHDIDQAQSDKIDHICRKLRLKPGERLADIGCGWGGLLIYAAAHYGVECVGFTLSRVQAEHGQKAIVKAGLEKKVRIELCDYRDIPTKVPFDKVTSVGMCEHIGNKKLPLFLGKVHDMLRPGGLYLHHVIHLPPGKKSPRWTAFSHKYVFPNGDMQALPFTIETAARMGLEVRDVENLREHYALTLKHWVRRLEANRDRARALVGEPRYRIFRLYMAGASVGFQHGAYQLNQTLFAKLNRDHAEVPMTRADLYDSSLLR